MTPTSITCTYSLYLLIRDIQGTLIESKMNNKYKIVSIGEEKARLCWCCSQCIYGCGTSGPRTVAFMLSYLLFDY